LIQLPGVKPLTRPPFFTEFALLLSKPQGEIREALARRGIHAAAPVPFDPHLALFSATEIHTEEDLLSLREALREVLG
ncbi:MAG: aminomethyl-transferring glycine dehydrogenase subunit GcvPA, partial [Thermaceae bacterium]